MLAVCVPGFALTPEAGPLITREDSSERIWSLGLARVGDRSIFPQDTDVVDGKEEMCIYVYTEANFDDIVFVILWYLLCKQLLM